jgi:hypothetical protein
MILSRLRKLVVFQQLKQIICDFQEEKLNVTTETYWQKVSVSGNSSWKGLHSFLIKAGSRVENLTWLLQVEFL